MNNKKRPLFSIVIPSHNRSDIIKENLWALKKQTFNDFEVILSDNTFSVKDCKEVFDQYTEGDDRFRYIKPDHELSMVENWEFALSYAQGEYINIFEDKHFMYFDCLERLKDKIITYNYPDAISYGVDLFLLDEIDMSGILFKKKEMHEEREASADIVIDEILNKGIYYASQLSGHNFWGGSLSDGMVRREIIEKVRQERGNMFLSYMIPDTGGPVLEILSRSKRVVFLNDSYNIAAGFLYSINRSNGLSTLSSIVANKQFISSAPNGKYLLDEYALIPKMYATIENILSADYRYALTTNPYLKGKHLNVVNCLDAIQRAFYMIKDWGGQYSQEIRKYKKVVGTLSEGDLSKLKSCVNLSQERWIAGVEGDYEEKFGYLSDFFERSYQGENSIEELLKFANRYHTLYCYGAGQYGKLLFDFFLCKGIKIDGFLVSGQIEQSMVKGIPVQSVSKANVDPSAGIILTLDFRYHQDVRRCLKELNLNNVFWKVPYSYLKSYYWLL